MEKIPPIAIGRVASLCINGKPVSRIIFLFDGPQGDKHSMPTRILSGHDNAYIRTSALKKKKDWVRNHRTWSGLSTEENLWVGQRIGAAIPQGILQENITFSGIPGFSCLDPTTSLVFPERRVIWDHQLLVQAILWVMEQNGPCRGVGEPLEQYYNRPGLMTEFVNNAKGRRGVVGNVYAPGLVEVGDEVLVYPPVAPDEPLP